VTTSQAFPEAQLCGIWCAAVPGALWNSCTSTIELQSTLGRLPCYGALTLRSEDCLLFQWPLNQDYQCLSKQASSHLIHQSWACI